MKKFKGKGEHSVNELEEIILEQQELLHQRQIAKQNLKQALVEIESWAMPSTGKFWDNEKTRPTSYGTEYGSNGERDYIRSVARKAINDNQ